MIALRHFSPALCARLEHELTALRERHEAMRADVVAFYGMTSRQIDPRSEPATLARLFEAQNDLGVARMVMAQALRDMRAGRLDSARAEIEAVLGEAHDEPAPIYLVNRVA